jgi:carboxyl-terminal processing protease
VVVARIVSGAPAAGARLRVGDAIRSIDGVVVEGMSLADVVERIRGENGTLVKLGVERAGNPVSVEILRGRVSFMGDGANLAKCGKVVPVHGTPAGLFFLFS